MQMEFYKYQGAGNDFVVIDNREQFFPKTKVDYIRELCHRRFGIGADGLMLLESSDKADFRMVYYNADGREGSMCGNGGRCIVAFAKLLGIIDSHTEFDAVDGLHRAEIQGDKVSLQMIDVSQIETIGDDVFMDTGSPHYIIRKKDLQELDIVTEAHQIRYSKRFKEKGTNVNFVSGSSGAYEMRTYERGVENETLACGTGATAVALALHYWEGVESPVNLKVSGGHLSVSFEKTSKGYQNVWLKGLAELVFKGYMYA